MYQVVHGGPKLKWSTLKTNKVFTVFLQLPNAASPEDVVAAVAALG